MTSAAGGSGSCRQKLFLEYTFRTRIDNFSNQVVCDQDVKFWFRLEVAKEGDRITDFFLGAFDPVLGGELLEVCYRKLNRAPKNCIVFENIFSSHPTDAATINGARIRLEKYAAQLLANYGRTVRGNQIELRPGNKVDLIIRT